MCNTPGELCSYQLVYVFGGDHTMCRATSLSPLEWPPRTVAPGNSLIALHAGMRVALFAPPTHTRTLNKPGMGYGIPSFPFRDAEADVYQELAKNKPLTNALLIRPFYSLENKRGINLDRRNPVSDIASKLVGETPQETHLRASTNNIRPMRRA